MWNLTPKKFKPIPQLVNVSRVNLAGDVMEDIEERNRSVEVKLVYKYRDQLTFWDSFAMQGAIAWKKRQLGKIKLGFTSGYSPALNLLFASFDFLLCTS